MENKSFLSEYKVYLIIGLLFVLLTYWYFWLATIADISYVYEFILQMLQGNFTGQIVPFESLTNYQQMEVGLFGPDYHSIAPEVIRAFEERQHLLPIVFLVEFLLFLTMFIVAKGRKQAKITTNKKDADLIFTTTHKSKGLEYEQIIMADDFITKKELSNPKSKVSFLKLQEELNIYYVAATRVKSAIWQASLNLDYVYKEGDENNFTKSKYSSKKISSKKMKQMQEEWLKQNRVNKVNAF